MKRAALRTAAVAAAVFSLIAAAPPAAAQGGLALEASDLSSLSARAIGPAVMSGRIAALDAVRVDGKLHVWVGAATGGVWKSDDGGVTWDAVFDDHPQSIGAVRVDPNDPETVWVGTGESWTRNSVVNGYGVYKTTDGGDDWQLMGLEETERIARIRVHPEDSDTVWVCATGHLWNAHEARGVYKTTDGGASWHKVLYVDQDTGCSDLDLDPQDPSILYAGMWQFRRYPDFFESGGPGSGLYRSRDGGETWEELTAGLPEGDKGRIAVAVAPSRPSRVYALVEAEETAVYRSDDLGGHWQRVNDSLAVSLRPFYFAYLVVDPNDHETVYKPGQSLAVSDDGGTSFTSPFTGGPSGVHSDHHALWVDPGNSNVVLLGTDGGVYASYDKANRFVHVRSLPLSQFYRVSVDDQMPYNVYGGLQDNGSWMGPSRSPGGIDNEDWKNVGFGDGFYTFRDPSDPDYVYSEYQGAEIKRLHLPSHEYRDIKPYPAAGDPDYRFNWNSPVAFSPHRNGTLYLGAQKLLRSTDHGESWTEISPDLTTDDPAKQRQSESGGLTVDNSTAENHTTIYTISESPLVQGVIWVGTDDGNLQVTRDDGETWSEVSANVPGLPDGTWVSSVEASPHDAATAHVAFDGHRSGDKATYVYRTADHGATWTRLAGGDEMAAEEGEEAAVEDDGVEGSARIVRQDPFEPRLLFLGTDLGLWMSLDGGATWARYEGEFPRQVRVDDLVVHPRTGDLVIATHGRGIYILDDLTPLRALDAEAMQQTVSLLPSRPAEQWAGGGLQDFSGAGEYSGRNPAEAAYIAYYQPKRHLFGDLKVEIYDGDGELVMTVPGEKRRGLNRVAWPMRLPAPKVPPASSLVPAFAGPLVPEGTYRVKLIKGKESYDSELEVRPDPRNLHPAEDRRLQQETALDLYGQLESMTYVIDAVVEARDAARERVADLPERNRARRAAEAWADELEELRSGLVATTGGISGDVKLREKLGTLYGAVNGYTGRPTASQLRQLETLRGELEAATARFEELGGGVGEVNRLLGREGLEEVVVLSREDWEARDEDGGGGGGGGTTAVALEEPVKAKGFVLSWLYALSTEVVRVR